MFRRRLLTIFIVLAPLVLAIYLVVAWTSPSGERSFVFRPGKTSPAVNRPLPDDRVTEVRSSENGDYIGLTDEPVYFTVKPPFGNFDQVAVKIEFDPQDTPIFELGALKDVVAQAFDFQPLANLILEQLPWPRYEVGDGKILLTDGEWDGELPPRSNVATYRATYPRPYREVNYLPCSTSAENCHSWNVALRGPHEAYTYIKDEHFQVTTTYVDVNRTYGADEGFVKVFNENGDLMKTRSFDDDGNISLNQKQSTPRTITVSGDGVWPEGVYRVVFSGTSDIVWRSFSTHQKYFVFKNQLYIGDDVGFLASPRATTFFTNSKRITVETAHAEGIQDLELGDKTLAIDEAHEKYALDLDQSGVVRGYSPVGDVKIVGEGKYAFSSDAFFDPDPASITAFTNVEALGVDAVYATLPQVQVDESTRDGWRTATATFPLSGLVQETGAYKFVLSAPGLEFFGTEPRIHKITVTFSGDRSNFSETIVSLLKRLRSLSPINL